MELIQVPAATRLSTEFGDFTLHGFPGDHLALVRGTLKGPVLTRLHSECLTSEVFGSRRCDCAEQLRAGMRTIAERGSGLLIYLRQEGRGIGLLNKLRAYRLQDEGADTVEANLCLGLPPDARDYTPALDILREFGVTEVELLTNNPRKLAALREAGLTVTRTPLHVPSHPDSRRYLDTKREKLGHL